MSGSRTVGLFVKNDAQALQKAKELEKWLTQQGIGVIREETCAPVLVNECREATSAPEDLWCVFVLGGDGTFLSAARWIGEHRIPLIGVKFGEIGFLAETAEDDLFTVAKRILTGDFTVEQRMRLRVKVQRGEKTVVSETVLNDIVINKGALARLASIETYIDDHYLTTFRADGLIVATPTGSTAYSLAAGGPVVHPRVPGIIINPICPFTLTVRPLVVPDSARMMIKLEREASDIMLTFDGQQGLPIDHNDCILLRKAGQPLNMIVVPGQQYFDVLKAKLRWSGGRG
jgi:NAD+ kinase